MLSKLVRFLCWLDDLAEVLVYHVLFSKKNWKKTVGVALVLGLLMMQGSNAPRKPKKALSAPVLSAQELADRGYEALMRGNHQKAVALLTQATTREPYHWLYQQRLGLALLEVKSNEAAKDALERSWRARHSRTTLFYLGCAYQNLKMNEVAIGYFNQAKTAFTKDTALVEGPMGYEAVANAKIGECYVKMGQFDRAIEILNRNIADYPNYPHSYFYLGIAQWDRGNPDLGVEQMFKVIALNPEEASAYYNVACYYAIKGIPDLSLVWMEKALDHGFAQWSHMKTDPDLDSIRDLPAYKKLVAKYQKKSY